MQECVDPGVSGDAVAAIAENRVYAACNKKKHRDTKVFYNTVKARFSGA